MASYSIIERRPKLLKDFLNDISNSCSSSGFISFPRYIHQPLNPKIDFKTRNSNPKTVSAFKALIMNAVKIIPFITVKETPSFLPRALSRKLYRKDSKSITKQTKEAIKISVRVKDILRWKSFRDVTEEKSQPPDSSPPLNHYTITTTTTRSMDSSSNSVKSSNFSWCESDFTTEFLPPWDGKILDEEKELEDGKKYLPCVGVDFVEADIDIAIDPQDEDEQQSPVSVFDFESRENEELFSSTFDQSIANVERTGKNLIEKIEELESLSNSKSVNFEKWTSIEEEEDYSEYAHENSDEQRIRELLVYVKATSCSTNMCRSEADDQLLIDFFREELGELKSDKISNFGGEFNGEIVRLARGWINGECNAFECGEWNNLNGEACFREMSKVGNWNKLEVEKEELGLEIGDQMVVQLIDEFLIDLFVK